MNKIRLLIVDDHPTFRNGLARVLNDVEDFECVGQAADGAEAIRQAKELHPDIVFMDICIPKPDGIQTISEIRKHCPKTAIIMFSAFDQEAYIVNSLRAGARGYLLKTASLDTIIRTVRLVHSGENVLDAKVNDKLMEHLKLSRSDNGSDNNRAIGKVLLPREQEVIGFIAEGMSDKEIAKKLSISERTVKTHLVHIFKKLGTNSRTKTMIYALREGWAHLDARYK